MNRFAKQKKEHSTWSELLLPVCFFGLITITVFFGVRDADQSTRRQQLNSTEEAVRRAAVQCYAVEGQYPQNLPYLEEHYGLLLDHEKYIIHYVGFASNLMPDIAVIPRDGSQALEPAVSTVEVWP